MVTSLRPTLPSPALAASIAGVLLAAYAGSLAAVMAEQFPPEVRTAGISLPYGVAVSSSVGCRRWWRQPCSTPAVSIF